MPSVPHIVPGDLWTTWSDGTLPVVGLHRLIYAVPPDDANRRAQTIVDYLNASDVVVILPEHPTTPTPVYRRVMLVRNGKVGYLAVEAWCRKL